MIIPDKCYYMMLQNESKLDIKWSNLMNRYLITCCIIDENDMILDMMKIDEI
jgi:hypothetical protein